MQTAEIIIDGIRTGYYACSDGYIISKYGNILKQCPVGKGKKYYAVDIASPNKRFRSQYVHRLVWIAINGEIPDGFEINHKDGDKSNNALCNLELTTRSGNCKHSFVAGLQTNVGINNPSCKISEDTALIIIDKIKNNQRLVDISSELNVSINIIKGISRGRTWKHLQN